jgi:hypothetical protein
MILSEANALVSLVEKASRWLPRKKTQALPEPESIASRLVRLFEAHGVHRNQISRVLGHGLRPIDLQTDESLMAVLTDEILDTAAALFAIRREWLDGASQQIYPLHDFYKRPDQFVRFIDGLFVIGPQLVRGVVLIARTDRGTNQEEDSAVIVLEQGIAELDSDRVLYRYHLCHNWSFDYWKSRAYLTACVASAWKREIHLMGREVPIETIRKYKDGERFLEYRIDNAFPIHGTPWYPEDMALKPEAFLEGLDEGDFGRRAGLSLWLELEAKGWMETGLPYTDVRQTFERALK